MKIGILGGSGIYELDGFNKVQSIDLPTPFGKPSDAYVHCKLDKNDVYFLPRHGQGHVLLPSEINHKANIFGFKMLEVERVLSISAVGSLREELKPRDIVLPDQYFDRTKKALEHTFFGNGIVAHISFGQPTCQELRATIEQSALSVVKKQSPKTDIQVVNRGTYVNMEGPAFSTKSESNSYRQLGFDIIGMTSLPEAKLCREAEICYQAIAMVTDYDCWREAEEPVSIDMIIGHLTANVKLAKELLKELIPAIPQQRTCDCQNALQHAILTQMDLVPLKVKDTLGPILEKYR
jgi:5'-methylthioadenosine phosphorylase